MPKLTQTTNPKDQDKEQKVPISYKIKTMNVKPIASPCMIWTRRIIWKSAQMTFWFLSLFILSTYASSYNLFHDSSNLSNWIRGGGGNQHSSSLFKVDPSNILTTIAKYGGLKLLPPSLEQDLQILGKVCSSDLSSLDIIYKEVEFRNLTLSVKKEQGVALQVGRLWMKWNSYHKPCLEIELEDVDIFVEFTNLMLTKTNWHELSELGFPPTMYLYDDIEPASTTSSQSMLRINSLKLLGSIKLHVHSRPLKEQIAPTTTLEFSSLQPLLEEINFRECTSTQDLYEILTKHINTRVKQILSTTVKNLATSSTDPNSSPLEQHKKILEVNTKQALKSAQSTFSNYAEKIFAQKEQEVAKNLDNRFKEWGLDMDWKDVQSAVAKSFSSVDGLSSNHNNNRDIPCELDTDSTDCLWKENEQDMGILMNKETKQKLWNGIKTFSDGAVKRFLGFEEGKEQSQDVTEEESTPYIFDVVD